MKILRKDVEARKAIAPASEGILNKPVGPMNYTYMVGASNKNRPSSQRCELEVRANYKQINKDQNFKSQERYALNR